MAGPRKFPDPNERSAKTPAVICRPRRILGLYNKDTGEDAQRISKKVREWFHSSALEAGWTGVHFLPEVETGYSAGCVLWAGVSTDTVHVDAEKVTLIDSEEGED
jgi:hypothetical protein